MKRWAVYLGMMLSATLWAATPQVVDGVVSAGEYAHTVSVLAGQGTLSYGLDDKGGLAVALAVKTTGWVGFGIGANTMNGATIFMGFVLDGKPVFSQQKGRGHTHSAMDIPYWDQKSVLLKNGVTIMEFHIPATQIPYKGNSIPFITAYSSSADLTTYHDDHDVGTLTLP